jgi:DNA segregation ATPase FtsK/SpoIIIE, S-DNA-T family
MSRPNLPAVPASSDVDAGVLDGEVIDGPSTRAAVLRPAVQVVLIVIRHEHARTAGRHVAYIPLGAAVVTRRLWDSRSTARYERMIRAAEAVGDHQAALDWDARRTEFTRARHGRRMDLIALPGKVAMAAPKVAAGTVAVLGGTGVLMAVATRHASEVAVPFEVVAHVVMAIVVVVSVVWGPLLLAAPWVALAVLWQVGRTAASTTGPAWLRAPMPDEDTGALVTADTIVLALQNLDRVPALKRGFKDGWRPSFTLLPVRDGQGYSAVFGLPLGVTPQMIADQRAVFARNLHRAEVEVWPTDAERSGTGAAGSVALWVADRGVLDKPAPEFPLLHDGAADVFTGVPAGVSPRGDTISVPIVGNNFVVGGIMGQGKSNACRVVLLGAALDPLAELWVHVFAYNGDFDAYAPRLARYVKGAEDAQIAAALDSLRELYEEVGRREARLAELGALKVTRRLAEAHPDLRPRLTLFSECHELFGHREFGEEAADLAVAVIRRARKTAVWLGFDTQDARKDAIPPKIVGLVSVNACFAVKTWRTNDGFLGDGSFQAGIRATELRPGRDVGRSLVTGVSEAQFELLKWHYIASDDEKGYDQAAEVIARAMKNIAPGTTAEEASPVAAIEARDLLADLAEVISSEDGGVRLADLPPRLRKLAPTWTAYRSMTGVQLADQLDSHGIRVTRTGNVPRLDPGDVRHRLDQREAS